MLERTNVRTAEVATVKGPRRAATFGLRMAALAGLLVGADGVAGTTWAAGTTGSPEVAVAAEPPPSEFPLETNPSTCC